MKASFCGSLPINAKPKRFFRMDGCLWYNLNNALQNQLLQRMAKHFSKRGKQMKFNPFDPNDWLAQHPRVMMALSVLLFLVLCCLEEIP